MNSSVISLAALLLVRAVPARTSVTIDPALVGTWKLDYAGPAILWVVRPDGTYRLHGPGAKPRQFGRMEGGNGRWSVKSAVWADEGTYKLSDAETWVVAGKLGTGTWKRLWAPGEGSTKATMGSGACRLVTPAEVARVLYAPAPGQNDARLPDQGCRFSSLFSDLDYLTIEMRPNVGAFFENVRKGKGKAAIDLPGVGDQAWAELQPGSALVLRLLRGGIWVTITLRLQPDAVIEDLPYLAELGRTAAGRI